MIQNIKNNPNFCPIKISANIYFLEINKTNIRVQKGVEYVQS